MSQSSSRSLFPLTVVLCLVALGLTGVPRTVADRARAAVYDASLPGHRLLRGVRGKLVAVREIRLAPADERRRLAALESETRRWRAGFRRLQAENGLLKEQLAEAARNGVSPYAAATSEPLVVPQLIEASVLGEESASAFRAGTLIDRGTADGLRESTLVLEESGPLVDQGEQTGLASGQPVYAGRSVIGKIGVVGRWTSTIQPLTDAGFRGKAQLARRSREGIVFGSVGILEGTGAPRCRLTMVPATEPVSAGDEVYTVRGEGALPVPLYYGQVVKADLKPGAAHWEIEVKPAIQRIETRTVQVLTRSLNPLRRQAN